MPVRLRIALLYAVLAFVILSLVCAGIYYFSYSSRIRAIQSRLTNRSITTGRLLSQREVFSERLMERIDSSTTISLYNKTVVAYNDQNQKIYDYSDRPGDTLAVNHGVLSTARSAGSVYFTVGRKDAVAYYYRDKNARFVVISAAEDIEAKNNLRSLLNILLLSFVVGVFFILLSGYFFSRGLLRPIKKITEDVAEISAQSLTRRIQTGHTKDEWYHLSDTLNDLLNRLQESFELQRRFISNASHELLTPLTAISSQLEIALQRQRDAEEYRKVMQSIYEDVGHLSKLTQTLLEVAKTSGSSGGLEISVVRIDEIILRLPAEIAKINAAYSVEINFDELPEEEENLLVYGNETLLVTAIKNIVLNACKHSGNLHAIISLKTEKNNLYITIEDRGVGIPKKDLENIFQPFYRVEENSNAGGSGLGLPLAQRIIKLHKGSIEVKSTLGTGTIFVIRLPVAEALQEETAN